MKQPTDSHLPLWLILVEQNSHSKIGKKTKSQEYWTIFEWWSLLLFLKFPEFPESSGNNVLTQHFSNIWRCHLDGSILDKNVEHFQTVMWVSEKTNGEVLLNMSKTIVIGHYNGK